MLLFMSQLLIILALIVVFFVIIQDMFCGKISYNRVLLLLQGATNHVHNAQMYPQKCVAYAKFLEVVQSFVRQYNTLTLL